MSETYDVLARLIEANEAPAGGFCLFRNGEVVEKRAIAKKGFNFDTNTKVRVASISKLVTAVCALKLWEDGKIDLDEDISQYLGFKLRHPKFPNSPITARMILSHTSGIRDGGGYKGIIGENLADFFLESGTGFNNGEHWAQLEQPFGAFAYSNLGMGVIAQMIENVSNIRFDNFANETVFKSLQLDCGFNYSGMSEKSVLSSSPLYRAKGDSGVWEIQVDDNVINKSRPTHFAKDGLGLQDYKNGTNGLVFSPQGGLRAGIDDLFQIAQLLLGNRGVFKDETLEMMRAKVWDIKKAPLASGGEDGAFLGFGTGIHLLIPGPNCPIANLKSNLFGHYGEAYGFLGGVWFEPQGQSGFVWFVIGSQYSPRKGIRSQIYALEEEMMSAAAMDLAL